MYPEVTLTMSDGTKVVVPDSLDLITPYVLREQLDWFEDEIDFLRRLLQPGQNIIDIGANYGVYTLSMAGTVGSTGHIWAFEPASATAEFLRKSIRANRFDQVTLERCALSGQEGTAEFSMNVHAELNSLVTENEGNEPTESVSLVTLDAYAQQLGETRIDFIKIDAEGEEVNILSGGRQFFAGQSPLVQYEVKEGQDIHLGIMQAFAEMGYASYRLVPELDVLVPVVHGDSLDRFQLNLFACRDECAEQLAADGWLVRQISHKDPVKELPPGITTDLLTGNDYDWRTTLSILPYGKILAPSWETAVLDEDTLPLEEALALYRVSHDQSLTSQQRFSALYCGFARLQSLVTLAPTHSRLVTLARLAKELGQREIAVQSLSQLMDDVSRSGRLNLAEPFLAPQARFDTLEPGEILNEWFMVGAMEELERLCAFSSIYIGDATRQRLERICASKFAGEDMQRRLALVSQRFSPT